MGYDFASTDVNPVDLTTSSHAKRSLVLGSDNIHKDSHLNFTRGYGIASYEESRPPDDAIVPKSACASSDSASFRDDATAAHKSASADHLSNSGDDGQILDPVLSDDKENTHHVNIETREEEHPHPPKRCRVDCPPSQTSPCQEGTQSSTALPLSE